MDADLPGGVEPVGGEPTSVLEELLTPRQVAALLQMRQSTVEDYARRGLLPSFKLGRHRRFVRSDVGRAIARLSDRSP